jgi:LuxR family transcriptional regulator, maltose regulon positive regulatory protein
MIVPTTKLRAPHTQAPLVARPLLMERLSAALSHPLTLLIAPSGYGKSTTLASWASGRAAPTAWLTLEAEDNEPHAFLCALTAALQAAYQACSPATLALAATPESPARAVLAALINDLGASTEPVVLVLDDYQVITAHAIHEHVGYWVAHMPPNVHQIIASRAAPPLALARMRGRGQLAEIGATDLALSEGEAASFLRQIMALALRDDTVQALHQRTGGWVAGLQLAALSLRYQPGADQDRFAAALSGSDQLIFTYLRDEVLRHQPPETQQFLLQTAILDELHEPLCNAVTGGQGAYQILEQLLASQLFIIPTDPALGRYRYHPLFRDLLRASLQQTPEQIPELHRRAAGWYDRQGQTAAAIEHSLQAADYPTAVRLIERDGDRLWTQPEMRALCRWAAQIPEALRAEHPRLQLLYSWALLMDGHPLRAEALVESVAAQLTHGAPPELLGLLLAIRAPIQARREPAAALEDYRVAATLLPRTALSWRGAVALGAGFAHYDSGDLRQARHAFSDAGAICAEAGNQYAAIYATYYRGRVELDLGRLQLAAATFGHAVDLAHAPGSPTLLLAAWGYLGLASVWREQNDMTRATHSALEALQLGKQRENAETICGASLTLAQINAALGQLDIALAFTEQAERIAHPRVLADLRIFQARLRLTQENLAAAERAADELDTLRGAPGSAIHMAQRILRARILFFQGRMGEARDILRRIAHVAGDSMPIAEIEARILLAHCAHALGDHPAALEALGPALAHARREGHRRVFLDQGPSIAALLRLALSHRVEATIAAALLESDGAATPDLPPMRPALIEPLSATERALLQLVAAGLSNQAIADAQHISLNTVKWHLKNIYGKLDVRSRTAALARAHDLGILAQR